MRNIHLISQVAEPLPQPKINVYDKVCKTTPSTSTPYTLTSRTQKKQVFPTPFTRSQFVNIPEAALITSSVRPPQTPQPARTSPKHVWHLCSVQHGTNGGSSSEGILLYRCTSKHHHDDRTPSAYPSILSHLTEACLWQLCLFRHGAVSWHGGGKVPNVHLIPFVAEP